MDDNDDKPECGYGVMGGIVGDVLGSIYQFDNYKTIDPKSIDLINPSCDYSDDSVMTVATMATLNTWVPFVTYPFARYYRQFGRYYHRPPGGGYGRQFAQWLKHDRLGPYYSNGNGSAMRVGPIGWFEDTIKYYGDLRSNLELAGQSAEVTHNHPDGIKGAKAVVAAIHLTRQGKGKGEIKEYVEREFGYDLSRTLDETRPEYKFDISCEGTVPVAIRAFLESESFEHAMQLAISVGGDADTIACITGSIAGAAYPIPEYLLRFVGPKVKDFAHIIARFAQAKTDEGMETRLVRMDSDARHPDWSVPFGNDFADAFQEILEKERTIPEMPAREGD